VSAKLAIFIGNGNNLVSEKLFSVHYSSPGRLVNKNNTCEPCGTKKNIIFAADITKMFFPILFKKQLW